MSVEVECSSCGGRMIADTSGIVVECPHCQTHLQIPDHDGAAQITDAPVDPSAQSSIVGLPRAEPESLDSGDGGREEDSTRTAQSGSTDVAATAAETVTAQELSESFGKPVSESIHDDEDETRRAEAPEPVAAGPAEQSGGALFPGLPGASGISKNGDDEDDSAVPADHQTESPDHATEERTDLFNFGDQPPANASATEAVSFPAMAEGATEPENVPENETDAPAAGTPGAPNVSASRLNNRPAGVPKILFMIVVSYATAVTIALILLWTFYVRNQRLNLPDVVPRQDGDGKVVFSLFPENAKLPAAHVLRLGETRRFGNLEITALKVTRGPVIVKGDFGEEPPTDSDVLKLWLEVRNVSDDQTFAPFGRTLVRTRSRKDHRANIFVARVGEKRRDGERVLMFDLPPDDAKLVLKGQQIDRALGPGDEFETFLASSDLGLDSLTGELVWRVHVRKGYNTESMWGVTTLFEVKFHSGDVRSEKRTG